ncbi:short-chain dehydrogenase oxidoreductase [Limosilactobacillus coleohominis DSM 14060]|nr:short-chain dehydrogenase oxidoreductase [Limosilactobacillus coleohominis DSM 14060]
MEDVRYMFEVTVFGMAEMTRSLLPQFRKQRGETIVNISSALALTTLPTMGFYYATKYAVEGLGDTLRKELAPLGINVLNVDPSGAQNNWSGDPQLIAQAIIDAVNSNQVPHHLPLGEFAYNGGLDNLNSLTNEIKANRNISLSTDNQN